MRGCMYWQPMASRASGTCHMVMPSRPYPMDSAPLSVKPPTGVTLLMEARSKAPSRVYSKGPAYVWTTALCPWGCTSIPVTDQWSFSSGHPRLLAKQGGDRTEICSTGTSLKNSVESVWMRLSLSKTLAEDPVVFSMSQNLDPSGATEKASESILAPSGYLNSKTQASFGATKFSIRNLWSAAHFLSSSSCSGVGPSPLPYLASPLML
mmetsp:Transcript_18797/g.39182  ORF Transcript_18797/g.39182 Transcript_18797/m.39182 type:complete len:208 (-) Transcript_18797:797-1420(-)